MRAPLWSMATIVVAVAQACSGGTIAAEEAPEVSVCEVAANFDKLANREIVIRGVFFTDAHHDQSIVGKKCKGTYLSVRPDYTDPSVVKFYTQVNGNPFDDWLRVFVVKFEGTIARNEHSGRAGANPPIGIFLLKKVLIAERHRGPIETAPDLPD